jgi:hypothetical protein
MDVQETKELMSRLAAGVGQRAIALRCECENLETAYVIVDEVGDVLVTDDHRTFQYLDRGTDSTYVPVQSLDMVAARQICDDLRVELKPAPPDGYPSIECVVDLGQPIAEAIERVAEAVDRVFELAMRRDLK